MSRIFLQEGLLFLLPFAIGALVLVLLRREVLDPASWTGLPFWLLLAGFSLVIAWTVAGALFGERHTTAYVPPHVEAGRLVPGHFR